MKKVIENYHQGTDAYREEEINLLTHKLELAYNSVLLLQFCGNNEEAFRFLNDHEIAKQTLLILN